MKKVRVYVTYKESILDPQGVAIKNTIDRLGYKSIEDVRMGKYFEIMISSEDGINEIEEICDKLLANPNMETYRYEIVEE